MATYDGPPTPGWSMRANQMPKADRAAEYDERARYYRARQQARLILALARRARR